MQTSGGQRREWDQRGQLTNAAAPPPPTPTPRRSARPKLKRAPPPPLLPLAPLLLLPALLPPLRRPPPAALPRVCWRSGPAAASNVPHCAPLPSREALLLLLLLPKLIAQEAEASCSAGRRFRSMMQLQCAPQLQRKLPDTRSCRDGLSSSASLIY